MATAEVNDVLLALPAHPNNLYLPSEDALQVLNTAGATSVSITAKARPGWFKAGGVDDKKVFLTVFAQGSNDRDTWIDIGELVKFEWVFRVSSGSTDEYPKALANALPIGAYAWVRARYALSRESDDEIVAIVSSTLGVGL